jgi:hypothetical protein
MYTVANLLDAIRGELTGLNTGNVADLNGKLERAAITLLMKADVAEMMDVQAIDCYDGVFDYTPPGTIFGSLVKDFRPQGISRSRIDTPYKKPLQDFDLMKQRLSDGTLIAFEQRGQRQIMRLAQTRALARVILDNMTATTGWTAAGDASGLAQDTTVYYDSSSALRFNLAANGTQGTLTRTINSVNLSAYDGVGVAFLAVRLPSASAITSIGVRIGSSAANYWDVSATQGFLGAWQANDWLIVALDLATMVMTGTVVNTAITYVQVYFNYTSTTKLSNVRVGGLWISLPTPFEAVFETPAIFIPSGSTTAAPQKTITNANDTITLGDAAWNLFVKECARAIAAGKSGTPASGVIARLDLELEGNGSTKLGLYQKYRGDNPSQSLRTVGSYYDVWR